MSDPVWYRSLYWRIAIGFIGLLAVLLLIQGLVFLWLTDRIVGPSSRSPGQLAESVASEIAHELERSPNLALEDYVRQRFRRIYQPFLVVLNDGRRASNRATALPPNFDRSLYGPRHRGPYDRYRERPDDRPRLFDFAPIIVAESQIGIVAVPANPPPPFVALRELGPTLTWIALVLLGLGSTATALLVFRPTHRRLRALEQAATALGQGRTDVRAIVSGGDEVSSLATTFNRMADDLAARAEDLAASDRARRQLLADVSHELMTPLSAIRGYTETLAMPEVTFDEASRQRYLAIVLEETHKLEAMIGDLLDLARLEGGGGTLVLQDVKVTDLLGRVADRHGPAIRAHAISFEPAVDPQDLTVRVDPQKMEQTLQNLAANALRHTPPGGRVELRAERRQDGVVISVTDTGPGIPPEHLPHIFDRFYKVDPSRTTADGVTGSGLGLSIVKAIVERHGGRITASNVPGAGARFDLFLPSQPMAPNRT